MKQRAKVSKRALRIMGALIVAGIILAAIFVWNAGSVLIMPDNIPVGSAPKSLPVQSVEFPSASGAVIHGWFLSGAPGKGAVILMHGLHGNRMQMLDQAQFLFDNGYSVLLFDFQSHGESAGKQMTFGHLESRDAEASVQFIHQKLPHEKLAVIGMSLGAASALLASPPLDVNAMVIESVYPTIEEAIADRLQSRLGWLGRMGTPLLSWQIRLRLGFSSSELAPIRQAAKITAPKLFIAGTEDHETTLGEAKNIFTAAAEPKEFWIVEGAGHINFHSFAKAEYERRILGFLQRHLN